ncbi:MAG TPA: helicase-related protein, partial [Thermoanaerobaculia bacterium]|nr:helicase-related protein [Thermoanaerobaculia bacterium]
AEQGATTFSEVEALVIDEADRLFDLGFLPDLRRILRRCPPPQRRHSMMFSATLSYRVMELAYEHLNQAERIEIRPEKVTADRVKQVLYHVASREKISLLLGLLRKEGAERTMLFVNTKRFAERLVNVLERHGLKVGALNGDIPQAKRLRILQEFKAGKLPLLVATDVASRGLHIEGVTHVVNVDLPQDPEDYVHRIGRTARAGASGMAISLACEDYVFSLASIEKLIGSKIPAVHADDSLFAAITPPRRVPPVMTGGSRHIAPERDEDGVDEPVPPPPAPEKAIEAAPVATPFVPTAEVEPPPAPGDAVDAEPALDAATEVPPRGEAEPPDFWVREAFGLTVPEAGFGVAASAASASPSSRRRRRRRRKGAPAPEAAAPTPAS